MKEIIFELELCPFCGQEATLFYNSKIKKYKACCDCVECFIQPETIYYENPNDAIIVWNKRIRINGDKND